MNVGRNILYIFYRKKYNGPLYNVHNRYSEKKIIKPRKNGLDFYVDYSSVEVRIRHEIGTIPIDSSL